MVEELLLIMVDQVVHQPLEDQVIHLLLLRLKVIMEVQQQFIHQLELEAVAVVLVVQVVEVQVVVVDQVVMELRLQLQEHQL